LEDAIRRKPQRISVPPEHLAVPETATVSGAPLDRTALH
jgi:hypothetical protein